ncbi:MAG: tRNA threonylcarbamoyladenosine biosynthesis protein RimN [Beggiatoa sp. IS2]|nr:MAG: tRNA threonylcarbamoyladenosine biosynthesis protein RimN [Beggiatoa sp. IS2]
MFVKQAVRCIARGGIIAYPTEAVYGLGCDPTNEQAIEHLLALKRRSWKKGLILIAADEGQLEPFLEPLTPILRERVFATWPGPVTWLLPAKPMVSKYLRGTSPQLAVRISAHPLVKTLCHQWGGALVSTSANLTGRPATKTTLQVRRVFAHSIDYILPGKVGERQRPSEIRDGLTNQRLRI